MDLKNKIAIYRSADGETRLDVKVDKETVWLNVSQMAELFGRDSKTIRKHIDNAIREELADEVVVAKFATTTQHGAIAGKSQTHDVNFYNLDVIISVGYRVKSKNGVEFRRWAFDRTTLHGTETVSRRLGQDGQGTRGIDFR